MSFCASNFTSATELFENRAILAELSSCENPGCPDDRDAEMPDDFGFCSEDCAYEFENPGFRQI